VFAILRNKKCLKEFEVMVQKIKEQQHQVQKIKKQQHQSEVEKEKLDNKGGAKGRVKGTSEKVKITI